MSKDAKTAAERAARDAYCLRVIADRGPRWESCVTELFNAHQSKFIGYCLRNGQTIEAAEDIAQNAWVKIVKNAAMFKGDSAPLTWMTRIVHNALVDDVRKRKAFDEPMAAGGPDSDFDPFAGISSDQVREGTPGTVRDAVQTCIDDAFDDFARSHAARADALRKFLVDEWPISEIAQFLARTEAATRQYLLECRKKLRPFTEPCRDLLDAEGLW